MAEPNLSVNNLKASIVLPFHTVDSLRIRMGWYVNLRWLAVFGILVSVPIGRDMMGYTLGYNEILLVVSIISIINLVYFFLYNHLPKKNEIFELAFAEIQIVIDLLIISVLIHYCGGIANPFYFIYLVQVILSGILFPGILLPYVNAAIASVLLTISSVLEHLGISNIYNIYDNPPSTAFLITALTAFYAITFSGIYIINNFMIGYRSLKRIIDEKNKMLEKSIEEKNKAFRFAAHELKSPMIAIKSQLDVIKSLYSDQLKPEIVELLRRTEKRSDQVLNMVKEIISITQINLGLEKPQLETVEYSAWVESISNNHQINAVNKSITYKLIRLHNKHFIEFDKTGLEIVLSNLISNAIRYTNPGGEVVIEPFIKKYSFGFSVKDNGIGIEQNELDKIFNEFYRGKKAKEMEQIGTGLGLNLVKEIVKINGGTVKVESAPGKGSTFTVVIPLIREEVEETEEETDSIFFLFE